MGRTKVYIADMDEGFVTQARGVLSFSASIEIVGSSGNGSRALKDVIRLTPEVLIADIPLPGLDGIALLRETRRLKQPPAVIVCTRFYSAASMECACRYGASFFLCKPIDPESLPSMISECRQCMQSVPTQPLISDGEDDAGRRRASAARSLLSSIGLSPRLAASGYILEAVTRYAGEPLLIKNLSRGLYSELARDMDTTVSRIERSLRSAIATAYARGSLSRYFSHRPTNKEFIEYVMRRLEENGDNPL